MNILGISAYYHNSAACLIVDGDIVAAAQEERFTRLKADPSFPVNAIRFCLSEGRLSPEEIDFFVFYDKPFSKFERIFETYLAFAPRGFKSFATSMPVWIKDKLFQKSLIRDALADIFDGVKVEPGKVLFSEHHVSHAASAFFPSPYENAAILTMDGVGEWATTTLATGSGNSLAIAKEIHFPHSLGLLYSAFTYYTGFKVNSGEYKVMGLAPYGEPKYAGVIRDNLIDVRDDGSFHLNMDYFDYCTGLTMTNARFDALFGGPPRKPEKLLTQKEMDLAASIQSVCEDVCCRARARRREGDFAGTALPCWRRRAQLRRERKVAAHESLQGDLDSAGGGRCGRGARRRARRLSHDAGQAADRPPQGCDEGLLSRAAL